MNTTEKLDLTAEFAAAVKNYTAGTAMTEQLRRKTLVAVVGPAAVGKSTIMDAICSNESDFSRVQSFTTRPRRAGEPMDTYRFLPHDAECLENLTAKLIGHELVQIAIHPTTGYIYGSESDDYPAAYNMLDLLSGEVARIRKLPFGHVVTIALATTEELWRNRFIARHDNASSYVDGRKRLDEAEQCLQWALNDEHVIWSSNDYDIETSAASVAGMARGDISSNGAARQEGIDMLHKALPMLHRVFDTEYS